jgi:hypothetical protein
MRHTFLDMAIKESRIPENKRVYQGEETAEALVNWLNFSTEVEAKKRIQNVVALFLELFFFSRAMRKPKYVRTAAGQLREKESSETRMRDEMQSTLNRALSYYQTSPLIYVHSVWGSLSPDPKNYIAHIDSRPVPGSAFAKNVATSRISIGISLTLDRSVMDPPPGIEMGEAGAIRSVLELIQSGHISKVRQCRCGQFFFQRFVHQRFCSEKCRIEEFRTSDEARQKRNAYARELYRLHKTKNLK